MSATPSAPNPWFTYKAAFNVGDRVRILGTAFPIGRITEVRGPLGQGGMVVYRVRVKLRKANYFEYPEDLLKLVRRKDATPPEPSAPVPTE